MSFDPATLDTLPVLSAPFVFRPNGGPPADADAAPILSDACGLYGIRRRDTGEILTAAGTMMTRTGTGTYIAPSFRQPDWAITYELAVQVLYQGQTSQFTSTFQGTAAPQPSAAGMVAVIMMAMRVNPAGLVTVTVDGQTTTWGREQALAELQFWKRQAAIEAGTRRRFNTIRMDRF